MTCCSEGGEIFIFPAGGAEGEFTAEGHHDLQAIASYDLEIGEEGLAREQSPTPRPWVALVPEPEIDDRLAELNERDDVAVACPNWRVSLEAPSPADLGVDFPIHGADTFLGRSGLVNARRGDGRGTHVVVLDSGVSPTAVCPPALNGTQLDFAQLSTGVRARPFDLYGHGSLVAALIHSLAPEARISSIRVFKHGSATLAEVIFGLLSIAQLPEPVHLVNLSFSVGAAVEVCEHCGNVSKRTQQVPAQLEAIFGQLAVGLHPCPIFVAAAGTGVRLACPASLPGVIAVDAVASGRPLASARGRSIEGKDEFVLAPGGTRDEPIKIGSARYYGSSFATAAATGLLAGDQHALTDSIRHLLSARREPQSELLRSLAGPPPVGYDPSQHGLGLLG